MFYHYKPHPLRPFVSPEDITELAEWADPVAMRREGQIVFLAKSFDEAVGLIQTILNNHKVTYGK